VLNGDEQRENGFEQQVQQAWNEFAVARSRHPDFVPAESAPVLFFGDLAAYRASGLRVVTVGLNPSSREFPPAQPWVRFPRVHTDYLDALSTYFAIAPLDWFDCFREVLRGLNASYGDRAPNRALHTDICSVLPTSPTWSSLPDEVRRDLASRGVPLWHDLVAELRPHVVVASVRYSWLDRITFRPISGWQPLHIVERANPYLVDGRRLELPDGSTTLLVRGRAANTPFGTVRNTDRYAIGASIRRSA
jgi:hypothetical protein